MSLKRWFENNFGGPSELPEAETRQFERGLDTWMRDVNAAGMKSQARLLPSIVKHAPSREEFALWRDDPVTRFVFAALERNAGECKDKWLRASWEGGEANQRTLDALRERSDALLGFTASYDAFCQTLDLEPEPLSDEDWAKMARRGAA